MHILFVGGTRFVGRAMAVAALERGHEVTLLHRGMTDDPAFADAEHLRADRDGDLSMLAGREFDATIDVCAYVPRQVNALAEALGDRGGHHVFVSTMSVFADADRPGLDEDSPLQQIDDPTTEEVTAETYGGLKVLCEQRAEAEVRLDDHLTVIRPTYVIGPHDHTGRFTWWVRRIARGGEVLAPGPADAPSRSSTPATRRTGRSAGREAAGGLLQQRLPHPSVRFRRSARGDGPGGGARRHDAHMGRSRLAQGSGRDRPVVAAVDRRRRTS